jgi:hypothetical protein
VPKVNDNDFVERDGIIKVEKVANQARCIWRETPLRDVGIDGQIEYVTSAGEATGRLVAVQVKSGSSYFRETSNGQIAYRIPPRHASYWESFPLPVVLVLHEEERDLTIWADARGALRRGEDPVLVNPREVFDPEGLRRSLALEGPLPAEKREADRILEEMSEAHFRDTGISLSFLDLFSHGLTDISRAVYFGMDLFMEVGEVNAALEGQSLGPSAGESTFEFIDRYVAFLVARNLARVDFDAWRQIAIERQMTGTFIAPLTTDGREVVDRLSELNASLPEGRQGPVTEERLIRFLPLRMEQRAVALNAIATELRG